MSAFGNGQRLHAADRHAPGYLRDQRVALRVHATDKIDAVLGVAVGTAIGRDSARTGHAETEHAASLHPGDSGAKARGSVDSVAVLHIELLEDRIGFLALLRRQLRIGRLQRGVGKSVVSLGGNAEPCSTARLVGRDADAVEIHDADVVLRHLVSPVT